MRQYLLFLLCVITLNSLACGPYWTAEEYYYHIFDQKGMIDPSYHPFIYFEDGLFFDEYSASEIDLSTNRNYKEWSDFFEKKLSPEQVYQLLVRSSIEEIEQSNIHSGKKDDFVAFARLARKVDNATQVTYDEIWEPSQRQENQEELINELKAKIAGADEFYKLRYTYQLSKLALQNREQSEINWIAENVLSQAKKNQAVYYYLQDHQAYFLKKTDSVKAAAIYIKNFVELPERRLSSMNSVRFVINSNDMMKANSYLKTPEETQALLFIKAFREGLPSADVLEEMIELSPKSDLVNLTLARALNEELRFNLKNTFQKINHIVCNENQPHYRAFESVSDNYDYYGYDDEKTSDLTRLIDILKQARIQSLNDNERWDLALAQAEFLNGRIDESNSHLKSGLASKNAVIHNQAKLLDTYNKISRYSQIGKAEEKELVNLLAQIRQVREKANPNLEQQDFWDYETDFAYDSENLFWNMLSEAYFKQGDYAKSFLATNSIESLNHYRDRCVIEDLLKFVKAGNHSSFEKNLISRIEHSKPEAVLKDYLAATYVTDFQYDQAIKLYKEVNQLTSSEEREELFSYTNIPKNIFATTYQQCYECEFESNLTKNQSSEIKTGYFDTKLELIEEVNRLRKSNKAADQLAYGNFLLNINRKGYFRNLFGYNDNGVNDHFTAQIDEYGWSHVLPISYDETANVFRFVLNSKTATDEEKAMAAWGVVQANQGEIEEVGSPELEEIEDAYDYSADNYLDVYTNNPMMKQAYQLLDQYRNAEFAREIIEECGYYRYHTNR